jgi:hypothetical protein
MATKKVKEEKVTPVEAVGAEEAKQKEKEVQFDDENRPIVETDWSLPISASNPPPSKRPLREQDSPVSDGNTLQKDDRELDTELQQSEQDIKAKTNSAGKKTRITDTGADVGGDAGDSNNVSTSTGR